MGDPGVINLEGKIKYFISISEGIGWLWVTQRGVGMPGDYGERKKIQSSCKVKWQILEGLTPTSSPGGKPQRGF